MGNRIARSVLKQERKVSDSSNNLFFSPPANPNLNQEWINPKDGKLYRFDGKSWIL